MTNEWIAPAIEEQTGIVAQLSIGGGANGSGGDGGNPCKCPNL